MSTFNSGISRALFATLGGTILAGQALLTACSDQTGPTPPPPPPPPPAPAREIPAYFYEVHVAPAGNTCGVEDPEPFDFLVLPQHTGSAYTIYGITDKPEPVTVVADTMTFSIPVQIETGSVTVGARWIFSPERHDFSGTIDFRVALTGQQPCSFAFTTTGTHDISLHSPDHTPQGIRMSGLRKTDGPAGLKTWAAAAAMARAVTGDGATRKAVAGSALSAGPGWNYGTPGSVFVHANECHLGVKDGVITDATMVFNAPFPSSRTNGTERVYFRYTLHGVVGYDAADLGVLTEIAQPFQTDYAVLESGWWYADVNPSGSLYEQLFGGRAWADYQTSRISFQQSAFKARNLQLGAGWWVTVDVYWPPNGNLGWGWHHAIVPLITGYDVCYS